MAFQHLQNSLAYLPPPFDAQKQKELKEIIKFENLSILLRYQPHNQVPPGILLRIIFFHGNGQDIHACLQGVDELQQYFFEKGKVPTSTVVLIVDYPGYSGHGDKTLLGTKRLDDEIERLWIQFVQDYPVDGYERAFNVCWSYSIGTHYACKLSNRRPDIDFLLLTAPFDHISTTANSLGAYFFTGPEWDGMNCLKRREGLRVMVYMAEKDQLLPVRFMKHVVKEKADDTRIELDRGHTWFTTPRGIQCVANFLASAVYSYSLSLSDSTKSEVSAEVTELSQSEDSKLSSSVSGPSSEVPLPSVMYEHLESSSSSLAS